MTFLHVLQDRADNLRRQRRVQRALTAPTPAQSGLLLGHLPAFRQDILGYFTRSHLELGDVVRYRMATSVIHSVAHPDGAKHILQDHHRNYDKQTRGFKVLRELFGEGLLTNEGDAWLRQRRMIQPAFHRRHVDAFGGMMVGAAERVAKRWEGLAQTDRVVDVCEEMMSLTLHIVTETLFGSDLDEATTKRVAQAIDHLLPEARFRIHHPERVPFISRARRAKSEDAITTLDDVLLRFIRARRARPGELAGDLLSRLIGLRDEETLTSMDDQQLRDEALTIFVAGHETTANALSWTWMLLSQHPDARRRLYAELDQVLSGRLPTVEDLSSLSWTRQVLLESMRLYPPAWGISRSPIEDDHINGHLIPARTTVFVLPYVTHRHPEFWSNPEGFDPERFEGSRLRSRPRFAYFPFGGGPRQCIGNHFALIEAQLALATLAQRFHVDLAPGQTITPSPTITLRPSPSVRVTIRARS